MGVMNRLSTKTLFARGQRVKTLVENYMLSLLDPEKIETKLGYDELPDSKGVHHLDMAKTPLEATKIPS